MVISRLIPMAPTALANSSGEGSMCGREDDGSFTLSMSKRTAPGTWPATYSASGSRFWAGRYQEPSTTTRLGSVRCSCSHAVETKGWDIGNSFDSIDQGHANAAVLLALLLDVRDGDGADLAGAPHMGAAAGLKIDALDLDQANAARSARRLHRHGLHESRIGVELFIRDP